MKKLFNDNKQNPWFWAFLFVAVTLLFAMPLMSRTAGNSGDEDAFQIKQGYNVLQYYKTHHQDTTCMSFENLKYYGCSFDVITAWINETFHVDNIHLTRHAANALMGWLIVLFVGLIAYRIAGWRAGVLAMVLMFFSPRFLGHSFNNPKDIPLATGVIMAIYYILMFFRQAPKPKWSTMIMLALSLALAISIRVGGLIIVGYFGLWGLLWLFKYIGASKTQTKARKGEKKSNDTGKDVLRTVGYAVLICVAGFFAGILLWPYAMQSPIKNTIDSYQAMSQFAIAIRQIYEGQMVWSDALPWYYTPKFILTTIPVAVILGWIAYAFAGGFRKERRLESIMLYFCFLFPVAWIVYTKANVYGGWRHSMFAYPPMVAVAGLGFDAIIEKGERIKNQMGARIYRVAATVLPFAMLIGPACHVVRNHPYEYVYFNCLQGGTANAYGQYEMDYYYHAMREATEWVVAHAEPKADGTKIIVGTWHDHDTRYFLRHDTAQFQPRFVRWYSRGDYDWDYAVFSLTGIDPAYLTSDKVFPPKNTVHTIEVDHVPIAVVLKRDDYNDYLGAKQKKENHPDSALTYFYKALQNNPYNESALINMAEIYLQLGKPDSTLWACNRFFEFEPSNDNANYFAAYAHYAKGEHDKALQMCRDVVKHNFKYQSAYMLILQILIQQNRVDEAEQTILQMMDAEQVNNQVVQYYVAIKRARGFDERMAYTAFYRALASSYEKRGKKAQAEMYRGYLKQM